MSNPIRLGLTGNIGSGKSSVAKLLVQKGAALIDADALAREATTDPLVLARIAAELGTDLIVDGTLDRAKTAELVFGSEIARQTLNGIIHPWVRRESAARVQAFSSQADPPPIILLDIPLLYENGLEQTLDAVVVVNAPLDLRVRRVMARSGLSETEVRARDQAQLPLSAKVARADYVIDNSGDVIALESRVNELWQQLISPDGQRKG